MKLSSYMDKKSWLILGVIFLLAFGIWSYNQKGMGFNPPVNDERCDECASVCEPCRDLINICEDLEDACRNEEKDCDRVERECDYAWRHCPRDIEEYCAADDIDEDECAAAKELCETVEACRPILNECKDSVGECWVLHNDCKGHQDAACYDCGECMNNIGLDPYKDCLKKKVVEMR